jgi:hypothetical protein
MKNVRTEIHITVSTFVGDDISPDGQDKPALSRTPDNVEAISLVRVSTISGLTEYLKTPATAGFVHAQGMLESLACTMPHRVQNGLKHLQP